MKMNLHNKAIQSYLRGRADAPPRSLIADVICQL